MKLDGFNIDEIQMRALCPRPIALTLSSSLQIFKVSFQYDPLTSRNEKKVDQRGRKLAFDMKTLKFLKRTDEAHLVGDGEEAQDGEDDDDVAEDLEGNDASVDAAGGRSQSSLCAVTLGHQEREVGEVVALAHRLHVAAGVRHNLDVK